LFLLRFRRTAKSQCVIAGMNRTVKFAHCIVPFLPSRMNIFAPHQGNIAAQQIQTED